MPDKKYKLMRVWLKNPNEVILDLWDYDNDFGFEIKKGFKKAATCVKVREALLSLSNITHDIKEWEDILYSLSKGVQK